jgi:hypothetical protein
MKDIIVLSPTLTPAPIQTEHNNHCCTPQDDAYNVQLKVPCNSSKYGKSHADYAFCLPAPKIHGGDWLLFLVVLDGKRCKSLDGLLSGVNKLRARLFCKHFK